MPLYRRVRRRIVQFVRASTGRVITRKWFPSNGKRVGNSGASGTAPGDQAVKSAEPQPHIKPNFGRRPTKSGHLDYPITILFTLLLSPLILQGVSGVAISNLSVGDRTQIRLNSPIILSAAGYTHPASASSVAQDVKMPALALKDVFAETGVPCLINFSHLSKIGALMTVSSIRKDAVTIMLAAPASGAVTGQCPFNTDLLMPMSEYTAMLEASQPQEHLFR